ncbi:MAG: NFACT family protein [archaeon]
MKDALSALDLHYLVRELQDYIPCRINQIYQDKEKFWFVVHGRKHGKSILSIDLPHLIVMLKDKPEAPEQPTQLAMALRKILGNAWIEELHQEGFERVISMKCVGKHTSYIFIEFFSTGNLILCDDKKSIVHALHMRDWKDRSIKRHNTYCLPPALPNPFTCDVDDIRTLLEKKPKSIVHFLAVQLGLGGEYAEEACTLAGLDKNKTPLPADAQQLHKAIQLLLQKKPQATAYADGCYPFALSSKGEGTSFESFNAALTTRLPTLIMKNQPETTKKLNAHEKIIKAQEEHKQRLITEETESQAAGEAIYNNYTYVKAVLDKINAVRKKEGWPAVHALQEDKNIIDIKEKEGKITLDLPWKDNNS